MSVRSRWRYLAVTAGRTRTALPPLAASLFALVGIFSESQNPPGQTWGLTAVICCALAAWLVGAVLAGEPRAQAEMASVALGGRKGRARLDLTLVGAVSAGLSLAFLIYPMLLSLLGRADVFRPTVKVGDLVAAALAQVCTSVLGGTIGLLFSPPRMARRPSAIAAVIATLLGLVALAGPVGITAGPVGVARALTRARPGGVDLATLLACASCLGFAAIATAGVGVWAQRGAG